VGIILTDSDLRRQADEFSERRMVLDVTRVDPAVRSDDPGLAISPDYRSDRVTKLR